MGATLGAVLYGYILTPFMIKVKKEQEKAEEERILNTRKCFYCYLHCFDFKLYIYIKSYFYLIDNKPNEMD